MSEVTVSRSRRPRGVALRALGDEHLARLAAEGDRSAFATIYHRHHQALYRYCRSIVHDPDDATDALQNTMLSALRGLPARNRDAPLKPWLFRIAHNEAINVLRRRRAHEDIDSVATRAGSDPERDVATRHRLRQLVADLQELPERQRGALIMREMSGLEYDEIGEAFGVSSAAAKQTVYEARVALQDRAEGRRMDCETVRRSLSEGDRRMLGGRKIRAHLGDCGGCASFAKALRARPAQLAALAPPLAPGAAAGLLKSVLGGSAGGEGGGAAAVAVSGGGKILAGSMAAKSVAVATVAVSAGAVGAAASGNLPGPLGDLAGGGDKRDKPALHAPAPDRAGEGDGAKRAARRHERAKARDERAEQAERAAASSATDRNPSEERGEPGTEPGDLRGAGNDVQLPAGGGRRGGNPPVPGVVDGQVGDVPVQVPRPKVPKLPEVTPPKVDASPPKLPNLP